MATVVVGIGLWIASVTPAFYPPQIAKRSSCAREIDRHEPQMELVGRITGMADCQWAGTAPGSPGVPLGQKYELASGLMEITYDTGAKVILQGPVTYEVESNGGYLAVGKLTGKLKKKGKGGRRKAEDAASPKSPFPLPPSPFVVRTPTATVTDLGTEFGVEVDTKGLTTSHVFSGVVEVQVCLRGGKPGQAVRLTENESVRIEDASDGTRVRVRRIAADPTAFVRPGGTSEIRRGTEAQTVPPLASA